MYIAKYYSKKEVNALLHGINIQPNPNRTKGIKATKSGKFAWFLFFHTSSKTKSPIHHRALFLIINQGIKTDTSLEQDILSFQS